MTPLAYCLELCTAGSVTASKCHGRLDQSCNSLNTVDACIPLCGEDADCPGRKCDPLSGFCVDKPATGGALGSACMKDEECAGGICKKISETAGVCSSFCRLAGRDSLEGCGYRRTAVKSAATPVGACLTGVDDNAAPGDLGTCWQLCDETADCTLKNPGWTCVLDPTLISILNHGVCDIPEVGDGGAAIDSGTPKDGGSPRDTGTDAAAPAVDSGAAHDAGTD